MIAVSLEYDLRVPGFGASGAEIYAAALEQCAWADRLGFDSVVLHEHHATADGYLPAPVVFGAAIAGRTSDLLIHLGLVCLPLHDPLRMAEDLAVLDLASAGRLRLTVGGGYRPLEYEYFDADYGRRPSSIEAGIEVLKRAWTGEPFEYRGRTVRVLPRPAQDPRPKIVLGGSVPAAARRAARIADGFWPAVPEVYADYLEELDRLGKPRPRDEGRPSFAGSIACYAGRGMLHVAEDVDAAWERIARYPLHDATEYASYFAEIGVDDSVFSGLHSIEDLKASPIYNVLTPEQTVALARENDGVNFHPLIGGMPPDLGWESLRLVEEKVLPELR